jgi:hypothetical protein
MVVRPRIAGTITQRYAVSVKWVDLRPTVWHIKGKRMLRTEHPFVRDARA